MADRALGGRERELIPIPANDFPEQSLQKRGKDEGAEALSESDEDFDGEKVGPICTWGGRVW